MDDQELTVLRERILERFTRWLDEALCDEEPLSGIPPELLSDEEAEPGGGDLYALWAATTVLNQEVKLQGRTFKQLSETLGPLAGSVEETLAEVRAAAPEREKRIAQEAKRGAWREILDLLLDLRDRMGRGQESARMYAAQAKESIERKSWFRLFRRQREQARLLDAGESLLKGNELSLEHLAEALERIGVREIPCEGETFDPHLMKAVDIEDSPDHPEGGVLMAYRKGYTWDGEVLRPAEVKVARRKMEERNEHVE